MKLKLLLPAFLIVAAFACKRPPTSDLETYLAERRAAGMSEGAQSVLGSIANVLAGSAVITYEKETDGMYLVRYSNALCLRPGMDPKQLALKKAKSHHAAAVELGKLKALADTDASGFVTTAEGERVAQLVRFAWQASFIAEHDQNAHVGPVAQAMGVPGDVFRKRLLDYRSMLGRGRSLGLKLEDVPIKE